MTKYVEDRSKPQKYELIGFSNHEGSLYSGHCMQIFSDKKFFINFFFFKDSSCIKSKNEWYNISDMNIRKVHSVDLSVMMLLFLYTLNNF